MINAVKSSVNIVVMNHCWGRVCEIIVGDKSHIFLYEQGGAAHVCICNASKRFMQFF